MSTVALTITLPLPPPELSPNTRAHWRRVAAAKKRARTAAKLTAVDWLNRHGKPRPYFPAGTRVRATATIYLAPGRAGRARDDDNAKAACKAYWDGWTDAEVWTDDRTVVWGDITYADERRPGGQIVLTLTAIEEG